MQWGRKYAFATIFLGQYICLTPISSGIVWIDKLLNCVEESCFLNSGCHVNKKKTFLVIIGTVARRKMLLQKHESYIFERPLKK